MDAYREDLAYIHESGHVEMAENAASMLLGHLRPAHDLPGVIVDLGCGGGTLAQKLCHAGYDVIGYDVSESMISTAKKRVRRASFAVRSFVDVDFPSCIAVTAIGEVFNYLFDERNDASMLDAVIHRIYAALCPGGILLFDIAGPDRAPPEIKQSFVNHPDWSVLVSTSLTGNILTRRITSFRRVADTYRRADEEHRLRLIDPTQICEQLSTTGFEVRRCCRYGELTLPNGLHAFLARKPTNITHEIG